MLVIVFNILAIATATVTGTLYWFGLVQTHLLLLWWYDIPLHLLGGLTFGLWGAALALPRGMRPLQAMCLMLALALVVGVAWEFFEYFAGVARLNGYWQDTMKDLADDLIGAAAVGLVYWQLYPRGITSKRDELSDV